MDMDEYEKTAGISAHEKYMKGIEFAANLKDVDFVPPSADKVHFPNSRNIFIMRHAERVDFVFGEWVPYCFDDEGNYLQKDLNLPLSLPNRKSEPQSFIADTPITNVGKCQAKSMGKTFKAKNVDIDYVYSSPALRCLQTSDAFLKGLGKKQSIKIRIEPALYEWTQWTDTFPEFMSADELIEAGYNIDKDYKSLMSVKELKENEENIEKHYVRGNDFIENIIKRHPVDNCLILGHASTLDTCSRILLTGKWLTVDRLYDLSVKVPYCSLVHLTYAGGNWSFIDPPCPPMSYGNNSQFDWKILLEKC